MDVGLPVLMPELIVQLGCSEGEQSQSGSVPQFADLSLTGADEFEDCGSGGASKMKCPADRALSPESRDSMSDVVADQVDILEPARLPCLPSYCFEDDKPGMRDW